jgi:predicted transcriptional regulator
MNHARILLKANEDWTDQAIAEALNISIPTIQRVRQRFIEQGFGKCQWIETT